jgi:hypothetical protein
MFARSLALLHLIVSLLACHSNSHSESEHFETKEITDLPKEIKVPSVIWDLLEEKKVIDSHGKIVPTSEISDRFEENVFVGLAVKLKEKSHGVLGGKTLELKSPKSGLSIDLANYVKLDKGTFIFSFDPEYKLDPQTTQVLFLSQSIAKRGNNQSLGSGCGKFYDVTKIYLKEIREKGIEVNVTDGRHVSFLAGTFFIRVSHEKGVRALSQLTITDSSHPELQCDSTDGLDERE